jgi:hypothetical protein
MGIFRKEITLANAMDTGSAGNGFVPGAKVRAVMLDAMSDTGTRTPVINGDVQHVLHALEKRR